MIRQYLNLGINFSLFSLINMEIQKQTMFIFPQIPNSLKFYLRLSHGT